MTENETETATEEPTEREKIQALYNRVDDADRDELAEMFGGWMAELRSRNPRVIERVAMCFDVDEGGEIDGTDYLELQANNYVNSSRDQVLTAKTDRFKTYEDLRRKAKYDLGQRLDHLDRTEVDE